MSVIIVSYASSEPLRLTLPSLLRELGPDDEVIVVDNASVRRLGRDRARAGAGGADRRERGQRRLPGRLQPGAAAARGNLLVFLNPDAVPQPGWGAAIRRPLLDGRGWDAWQALVLEPGGSAVNTAGNVVHFTGVAWAGQAGGRSKTPTSAVARSAISRGACLAIPA